MFSHDKLDTEFNSICLRCNTTRTKVGRSKSENFPKINFRERKGERVETKNKKLRNLLQKFILYIFLFRQHEKCVYFNHVFISLFMLNQQRYRYRRRESPNYQKEFRCGVQLLSSSIPLRALHASNQPKNYLS